MPIISRYGEKWREGATDEQIELACFYESRTRQQGGLGRFGHLKNSVDLVYNDPRREWAQKLQRAYDPRKEDVFIWNDWSELMMATFCGYEWTTVTGPNASWKTTCGAMYGRNFWACSPTDTIVVITSTSIAGLRRRIWKEMLRFHRETPDLGNVVASDMCIRTTKGSDEAGIFGIATGTDNDIEKAVQKIIGFHAKNVLAVCDELQATNNAIVDACISLRAGADRFQFIGIGNIGSELDPLGELSEPEDGWPSVTVEDQTWKTKRGICIHLDGHDSPRVREGREFYPGLLTKDDLETAARDHGEDSPYYWQYRRGFLPPEGISRTVLSFAIIEKFHARERPIWVGKYTVICTLDPSFGGEDRCVLRFFKVGEIDGGLNVLSFEEIIYIKLKATKDEEPIDYQIAHRVMRECQERNVPPEMFATDDTGAGGGPASILEKEWGAIMRVSFGGRPSKEAISPTNSRPADIEYDRKVTELWYRLRTRTMLGQIRNLDKETALELCQREYETRLNVIVLETKEKMKERTRRSPDLGDNACLAEELARKRGLLKTPEEVERPTSTWAALAKRFDVRNEKMLVDT